MDHRHVIQSGGVLVTCLMVLLGAGRSVRAQDANAEPPLTAKSVLAALKQAREAVDDAEVRAEVEAASTSTKTQTSSATPSANTQSNKQPNRNTSNDRITTTSVLETEAPKELLSEQYVRVGVDERVTMHVSGLPLADAVRMLSEPTQRNIILGPNVTGTVGATLYDVTFEEALNAMLISNGLGYREQGNFIFIHTAEEIERMRKSSKRMETRVFRLSYVRAAMVKDMIEPLKSEDGVITITDEAKVGLGDESGLAETGGDDTTQPEMLMIRDYEGVIDEMEHVIREVDRRPKQVLIEATILRASLNQSNALGIDFTTVGGIDFAELSSTSNAAQDIATGATPAAFLDDTTLTARTNFNNAVPNGGFTFGILKDQVGVFIRALEQVTDTNVIANPKVLALNKQPGQMLVGNRDGYITTTITETTAVQNVEFLETGTLLTFRPFIGEDGYVRMEIHPKDSTGGVTAANLPFESTTEVTTNIMVKDGHTILIGGLFREVSTASRSQVPGLGDLDFLGPLFRSTNDNTIREEVIVLLTVRIVKEPNDYAAGEALYEDVERIRMGARKGMQIIGRERLSQYHYQKALEYFDVGDMSKAQFYARLALNGHPQHTHARKLLEQIEGKREWESEASSIRSVVRDLIRKDRGEAPSAEHARPGPPFDLPELGMPEGEDDKNKMPSKQSQPTEPRIETMQEVSP